MYKITIEHLRNIKKALEKSNRVLKNTPESIVQSSTIQNAISQNEKAIELIDEQYLNIEP